MCRFIFVEMIAKSAKWQDNVEHTKFNIWEIHTVANILQVKKKVILREFCVFYLWILFSMCWKFWCLLERHRTVCWHNGLILFDICFNKVGLRLGYFTTSIGLFSHWICECWFHKRVTVCTLVLWLHSSVGLSATYIIHFFVVHYCSVCWWCASLFRSKS